MPIWSVSAVLALAVAGAVSAQESLQVLQQKCEAGKTWDCHTLADRYERGEDAPQDPIRAAVFWRKTCEALPTTPNPTKEQITKLPGVVEHCWGSHDEEQLQRECGAGEAGACWTLLLRHRDERGVPHDPTPGGDWLIRACKGGFGQACFTACLAEIAHTYTCGSEGDSGPEPWRSLRAFLAGSAKERFKIVSTCHDVPFLWEILRSKTRAELASLPEMGKLRDAVHARIIELAQTHPDPTWRAAAVRDNEYSIPEEVLKAIARKDPDPRVRKEATERLGSDLSPAWNQDDAAEAAKMAKSRDADTRRAAVGKMEDQRLLAELAEKDPDPGVREDAVDKLTDQAALARIAEKDKDERVRTAAVALVTDQKLLARLVRTSRTEGVRRHALENLTDQPTLAWLAEREGNEELRKEAASRLTDQATLARIAKADRSGEVRGVAASLLKDQRLLAEIVKTDRDPWGRLGAIAALTDRALLADVAKNDPAATVREVASKRLKTLSQQ